MQIAITNVHEALQVASDESKKAREGNDYVAQSFKINRDVKTKVEEITAQNGTDSSAFYRACAHALIADYAGIPAQELAQQIDQA